MMNETARWYQSRRGSVSVLLSLAGLGVIVIGIIVGNTLVRQGPRQLPRAQTVPTPTGMCGKTCTTQSTCGPVRGPCAGGTCTLDDMDYSWENAATAWRIKKGTDMWRYVRNATTGQWDFVSTNNFAVAPFNHTTGIDEMDWNMEPVNGVMTNILRLRKGNTMYAYRSVNNAMQLTNTTVLTATAPFNAAGGVCAGGNCHMHEFDVSTEQGGRRIMRFREGNIFWVYEYINGAWVFKQNTNLATTAPFNAADGICPGQVCTIHNFDFSEENGVLYARFRSNNIIRAYRYTATNTPPWALTNTSPQMTTMAQLNDPGSGLFCDGGTCKIAGCVGKACTCTAPTPVCVPTLIAPANNSTVQIHTTPGILPMQWSCQGGSVFRVEGVEVRTGGGFSSPVTGTTYTDPNGFYPGEAYDWKVRNCGDAACSANGAWSSTFRFTPVFVTLTPTVTPSCLCSGNGTCDTICALDKYPAANGFTYANPYRCARTGASGNAAQLNQWCSWSKRPRGDANGDGVINLVDYNYYRRAVLGAAIAATANPDFNGDGQVGEFDIPILKKTLQTNGLPIP